MAPADLDGGAMTAPAVADAGSAVPQQPVAGRLRFVLDRRAGWIEALVILTTIAVAFVVLGFVATYFRDYFRIIVIFTVAWLLALLIAPLADRVQRLFARLPRALAVIAVIVPVIVLGAGALVWLFGALNGSFDQLAAQLPVLVANPPPILEGVQRWANSEGINVDVVASFKAAVGGALAGATNAMVGLFGGAVGAIGTLVDGIIVVSLAVYMAIDRDKIVAFGLELTPPSRREDAIRFRSRRSCPRSPASFAASSSSAGCTASGRSSRASSLGCRSRRRLPCSPGSSWRSRSTARTSRGSRPS
jgi:hypothetical protein